MVAKTENITSAYSASGVTMPFEHMLSNIRVNLQNSNVSNSIYVKSYTLSGMYASADYAYSYQDGAWVPTPSGDRSFSVSQTFDSPEYVNGLTPYELLGEDVINCIPAANAYGDVKLVLDCLVTIDGVETQKEFTLNFPEGTWEKGKRYTYSATLSADDDTGEGGDDDIVLTEGCYILVHQASGKILTYNSGKQSLQLVANGASGGNNTNTNRHFQIVDGGDVNIQVADGVVSKYRGYLKLCSDEKYVYFDGTSLSMTMFGLVYVYFVKKSGSLDNGQELTVDLYVPTTHVDNEFLGLQADTNENVPSVGNDKDNTWTLIPVPTHN